MTHWIYAAVIVSIIASMAGIGVGIVVLRRVIGRKGTPRPIVAWLLFVLVAMSIGQFMEQVRVLIFRLSFDGLIERSLFAAIYGETWNVVSSKVLMSVAMMSGAAVKLGLYFDRSDEQVARWGAWAAALTVGAWAAVAGALAGLIS